jgi:hypothetical protein
MLLKILVVGAVLIAAMGAIRDGRILRDAGLLHSCTAVAVNRNADPTEMSCSKGRLDGFPDLTNRNCKLIAARPKREYWRCAAPLVSSQSPTG